ncbi:twin-arginine translocation pathway signal protein [Gloeomargarita lithophora Alchichica-D10]|uniref:Twin-arginine translocation pathway signal protein n=1 Tax=Gloeomargarita lithophora Alchichica-D10 TaxID=1188229 RepID=A0A1J0ADU7_9CYAN|nr:dienelactone hydrolase family protein [Gloeomargarita lithophora]APB34088.1 twin-arginine translocation pathway signal protein [Gloeomargarita lithophora Alchichica-D10]
MAELSRRQFVATAALTTGFAIAVQPIAQGVIRTDAQGLRAGTVRIPVADGEIPAYRAMPAMGANLPTILVIQEIFGVHEHIQDICRRLAKLGYLAIAPELFARQGDVSKLNQIDEIRAVVAQVPDGQVMSDLDATVTWAVGASQGNGKKLAITGFCWGGRITWLYAAHQPQVKTGVAWYGRLVGNATERTPRQPVDVAAQLRAPVLGLYGGQDTGIPLDTVALMRERLQAGTSSSQIVVYPEAPHAFFADYRPSYREADAQDAWNRLQVWLRQYGVSP